MGRKVRFASSKPKSSPSLTTTRGSAGGEAISAQLRANNAPAPLLEASETLQRLWLSAGSVEETPRTSCSSDVTATVDEPVLLIDGFAQCQLEANGKKKLNSFAWEFCRAEVWKLRPREYEIVVQSLGFCFTSAPKLCRVRWSQVESWTGTDSTRRFEIRVADQTLKLRFDDMQEFHEWRKLFTAMLKEKMGGKLRSAINAALVVNRAGL